MSSNLEIFLMSFSVPIGGTVVTAIALIIFNRKWICKQFSQCCLKLCLCTNNHQEAEQHLPAPPAPVLNDDLEEDDLKLQQSENNRWQHINHNHHHNHFSELYHLHDHHDESKV